MTDTNVLLLSQPGPFADPLTEVLRNGARALLAQAVEAEVAALVSCHADKLTNDGRQRLGGHGGSVRSQCAARAGATASAKAASASAFRQRFCLPMRADRRASKC